MEKIFFNFFKLQKKYFLLWGSCILPNSTSCWGFQSGKLRSVLLVLKNQHVWLRKRLRLWHYHVDRDQHQRLPDLRWSHLLHILDTRILPKSSDRDFDQHQRPHPDPHRSRLLSHLLLILDTRIRPKSKVNLSSMDPLQQLWPHNVQLL